MNYTEALAFIEGLPKFAASDYVEGAHPEKLLRMRTLLDRLGRPQDRLRFVHIAGTNGKGSTAAFMQSILMESGLKTGLYTSPALDHFTERIRINDQEITEEELSEVITRIYGVWCDMEKEGDAPSEYEVVCAAAFLYFANQQCDIAVVEVGLGGRMDATNVIAAPELAMIMSISPDHTQYLGHTLPAIASEKAGIIKRGGKVLVYPQSEEVEEVFIRTAKEREALLTIGQMDVKVTSRSLEGQTFHLKTEKRQWEDLHIALLGRYQVRNASMAVQGAEILAGSFPITEDSVRRGLKRTSWPGRFELMHNNPAVVVDGGHNEEGARVLAESLETYFPNQNVLFVTGVMEDKDYMTMMENILPLAERFYTTTPPNPRALDGKVLAEKLRQKGAMAASFDDVLTAARQAMSDANGSKVVCVFGSLYFLGQVRSLFLKKDNDI